MLLPEHSFLMGAILAHNIIARFVWVLRNEAYWHAYSRFEMISITYSNCWKWDADWQYYCTWMWRLEFAASQRLQQLHKRYEDTVEHRGYEQHANPIDRILKNNMLIITSTTQATAWCSQTRIYSPRAHKNRIVVAAKRVILKVWRYQGKIYHHEVGLVNIYCLTFCRPQGYIGL